MSLNETSGAQVSFQNCISYEGIITGIKSRCFGIYELDNKVFLYTTFNLYISSLPLKVGLKILVNDVHIIAGVKEKKLLVCCDQSSIEIGDTSLTKDEHQFAYDGAILTSKYHLGIFDILWIEEIFKRLAVKFLPSIIPQQDNPFTFESECVDSILQCFTLPDVAAHKRKLSQIEETSNNYHSCSAFLEHVMPTGYSLPFISDILATAKSKLKWIENSRCWKTSSFNCDDNGLLVGMLHMHNDGNFYIADNSFCLPCIINDSCDKCEGKSCIVCEFRSLNLCCLAVLYDYQIIFEKISGKSEDSMFYLNIPACYFTPFIEFHSQHAFPPCLKNEVSESLIESSVSSISDLTFNLENLTINECPSRNLRKTFIVLEKLWSVHKYKAVQNKVLVSFVDSANGFKNHRFNETGDNKEFSLVDHMRELEINDKSVQLQFESMLQSSLLKRGHLYTMTLSDRDRPIENNFSTIISADVPLLHHSRCPGGYELDIKNFIDSCSIKEIISKRTLSANSIVKCILKDKFYDSSTTTCNGWHRPNQKTLILLVKDCTTTDCIRIYIPYYPQKLYSLIPGALLELYGFTCICSQKGYLYLKSTAIFGIHTNYKPICSDINITSLDNSTSELNQERDEIASLSEVSIFGIRDVFKCLCFVVKIISAEIFLTCECGKRLYENCLCSSSLHCVKTKLSFLIDDGSAKLFAHCNGGVVRKILNFEQKEWQMLTLHVQKSSQSLIYHSNREISSSESCMNEIFCMHCMNDSLCRRLLLKCRLLPNQVKNKDVPALWCMDAIEWKTTDMIKQLYVLLMNQKF